MKEVPAPPTPPMGDQLPNFHELEVRSFKGPWSVVCGQMRAEATVSADGLFDMHQKWSKGHPGGWSALRCKITSDRPEETFLADIDANLWRMVEADMDPQGKSVIVWECGENPQSIWTRTKRSHSPDTVASAVRPKAKAKSQVRRVTSQPTTPISDVGSHSGPIESSIQAGRGVAGSPTPNPVEWYTEIRDGRLMWTDGISAVPAEERVTDDNRQKTKMQF